MESLQARVLREARARQQAEDLLHKIGTQLFERTEQLRQYTQQLVQQMEEMHAILDTAAEGIVTVSPEGIIYRFNHTAELMFGTPASRMIGRSLAEFLPNLFPINPVVLQQPPAMKQPLELEARRGDGSKFPAEVSFSPWQLVDKTMYTATIRDNSHRRALETRLILSQKLESVGRLAAGIAHEINSPIQYVSHNVNFVSDAFQQLSHLFAAYELLLASCRTIPALDDLTAAVDTAKASVEFDYLCDEIPSALQEALEGTKRVSKIVLAIREFSHPGSRQPELVDVNRVIVNAVEVARNEWKHLAEFQLQLDSQLPPLSCFGADLGQALLNLIINAAHAIRERHPDGESLGQITVTTRFDQGEVEIAIADTGNGIDQDHLGRIFEPFFTTKGFGEGTGQGLAICQAVVVDKHDGWLEVSTARGAGTTFVVRLPSRTLTYETAV